MPKENHSKITIIAVCAAVLITVVGAGLAVYALALDADSNNQAARINYWADGFDKTTYTAKPGEKVIVKNQSNEDFYFTTGEHAHHDVHSPMNLGTIEPGKSSSFVAPAAGSYGFHNHDNPVQTGELIVQ